MEWFCILARTLKLKASESLAKIVQLSSRIDLFDCFLKFCSPERNKLTKNYQRLKKVCGMEFKWNFLYWLSHFSVCLEAIHISYRSMCFLLPSNVLINFYEDPLAEENFGPSFHLNWKPYSLHVTHFLFRLIEQTHSYWEFLRFKLVVLLSPRL